MHYLGRFDSREFKTVTNLKPDFCEKIYQDNLKVREMLDYFKMWKSVNDAWLELSEWAMNAQIDGSNLLSQQQKAESLVRGYLTEFKITLEHVESKIQKDYTDNSDIYRAFKQATHAAYDGCSEYAFTCQLRNCVEHEKEVVHGFNGCLGCKISCNKKILLTTNSRWKKKGRLFMDNYPRDDIDLLDLFQKSFNALQEVMKVVINYFMTTCRLEFTELYDFGKSLKDQWGQQFNECHLFHLTDEYGNVIPIEEMGLTETKISVDLIDWNLIFELGDDCTRTK